jgi:dipeptidyl aminopeptidase/acylaminoacyl peptidase
MRDGLKDAGKQVDYVEFKDQTHSIASSAARTAMLVQLDAFLTSSLDR